MSPLPVPFVPVPARLIDGLMPQLTDTEWRLVCAVARATLGWAGRRPGTRREWAVLSHAQLKRRTGRESAAVSGAVARLIAAGWLEAAAPGGRPLESAAERRRAGQPLRYRLSPALLTATEPGGVSGSGNRKAKRTKERKRKRNNKGGG